MIHTEPIHIDDDDDDVKGGPITSRARRAAGSAAQASDVPENADPYRPPHAVDAAGGILTRRTAGGRDVLLIHRRGIWDLPKGKRDAGETLEACARREVREELGIDDVVIDRPLGRTVHGYVDGNHYAVKTTHWYQMHTDFDSFTPEEREGIMAVSWMPWPSAIQQIGFPVLRRHLESVERLVVDR